MLGSAPSHRLKMTSVLSLGVWQCRVSTAFVSGNISSIALIGTGTSNFYINGTATSVVLDLSGVSQASLDIPSGACSCHMYAL